MPQIYDYPEYYEVAFSFRDIPSEVSFMEACISRFSHIPVKRVFEVACGPAPHAGCFTERGYRFVGLDNNRNMLDYAAYKWRDLDPRPEFIEGNMVQFQCPGAIDFAFIMLGSLYIDSRAELTSHFDSLSRHLKSGGLYFLDYCVHFEPDLPSEVREWSADMDGVHIDVAYVPDPSPNRATQVGHNLLKAHVTDKGREIRLESDHVTRAIYPQEFLLLVEKTRKFEFVGWWNHWDLKQPIEKARRTDNPITIIRRT